ncbi:MAG: DUF6448 family protein [Terriglobales bacterium]
MKLLVVVLSFLIALGLMSATAYAHCDTLRGPVIADGRAALEKSDVTPVLKWIKPEHETELRAAFQKAVVVRPMGKDAKEIADRYFLETLVRLHRAGEGAPFTGLKDEPLEPAVAMADKALSSGSADELVRAVTAEVAAGVRQRFAAALEASKHAGESVVSGREYVARYVELMHYLERLHVTEAEGSHVAHTAAHHAE